MKARYILLIGLTVALFFPRFEQQGLSYQESLWTSEWMKERYPSSGFLFRVGEVDEARMWNRLRLGFPLGAVTIDSRFSDQVIQGRVETGAVLFNVCVIGPPTCGAVIATLLMRRWSGRGTRKTNKGPTTETADLHN